MYTAVLFCPSNLEVIHIAIELVVLHRKKSKRNSTDFPWFPLESYHQRIEHWRTIEFIKGNSILLASENIQRRKFIRSISSLASIVNCWEKPNTHTHNQPMRYNQIEFQSIANQIIISIVQFSLIIISIVLKLFLLHFSKCFKYLHFV